MRYESSLFSFDHKTRPLVNHESTHLRASAKKPQRAPQTSLPTPSNLSDHQAAAAMLASASAPLSSNKSAAVEPSDSRVRGYKCPGLPHQ